jgi:hypothetical protein
VALAANLPESAKGSVCNITRTVTSSKRVIRSRRRRRGALPGAGSGCSLRWVSALTAQLLPPRRFWAPSRKLGLARDGILDLSAAEPPNVHFSWTPPLKAGGNPYLARRREAAAGHTLSQWYFE